MVFFTCNNCGESVKKPSVEKHYNTRCRGTLKNVSCMDCQKDFRGEEYVAHTKCITEAEKYSGKDYVHKESKNSGAKKQESWMDIVRSILETSEYNLSNAARNAFQRLQSYDNVPRKKAKFQNFVSNCMRMPKNQAEEVWNILEKEIEKMKQSKQKEAPTKQANGTNNENGQSVVTSTTSTDNEHDETKLKKSKKRKATDNDEIEADVANVVQTQVNGSDQVLKKKAKTENTEVKEQNEVNDEKMQLDDVAEFQWSTVLEKIVAKHADGITLDKLKKKLIKKYTAKLGVEALQTEKQKNKFEKKFTKHLKKCPAVQIENDLAKPC